MSNYRAGDMIRLTRIANEMSQEELSEGICSVQTLHRIENGRTRVKKELYYKLMKKMNRIPEKNYAVCVGRDMELLKERFLFEDSMSDYNYEEAERYLKAMEKYADDNVITVQYLKRARALLSYYQKKINEDGLLRELEESLSLTVPDYRKKLEKDFPFTEQELMHLMSIASVYVHQRNFDDGIARYKRVLYFIRMGYMFGAYADHMELMCKRNIAYIYLLKKDYRTSVPLSQECVAMAEQKNEGKILLKILNDMSCAIMDDIHQNHAEEDNTSNIETAKKYMIQSYYIALAKGEKRFVEKERKNLMKYFNETL